ncbi:hypothetical protein [Arthrobacter sp. MDT1-65]
MDIHRNHRKHTDRTRTAPSPSPRRSKARTSFFDGLDTAARSFLGPADRTDGDRPVVHLHDAAEDIADATLESIEIHTDSAGHHYGQRRAPLQRPGPG